MSEVDAIRDLLLNKRVRNKGDICNAPREGTITDIASNRWGTFAIVTYDEPENQGWEYDDDTGANEPVKYTQPTSEVPAHHFFDKSSTARWKVLD